MDLRMNHLLVRIHQDPRMFLVPGSYQCLRSLVVVVHKLVVLVHILLLVVHKMVRLVRDMVQDEVVDRVVE